MWGFADGFAFASHFFRYPDLDSDGCKENSHQALPFHAEQKEKYVLNEQQAQQRLVCK